MELFGTLHRRAEDVLYAAADGIGFCVAELRLQVLPKLQSIFHNSRLRRNHPAKLLPDYSAASTQSDAMPCDQSDRLRPDVTVRLVSNTPVPVKKYDYNWAVSRMDELEGAGVSDPVGYFNNEMADWWLAPDGMMENEADFVGIAKAIEERW
ncbi:MAG: hypothetical protein ABJN40_11005 [Sneathiella sp.]